MNVKSFLTTQSLPKETANILPKHIALPFFDHFDSSKGFMSHWKYGFETIFEKRYG